MNMKIWHISDTHNYHELLKIPDNIDTVVFSGDCSQPMHLETNFQEVMNFVYWFSKLPIKNKIMIAGNHDNSFEKKLVTKEMLLDYGIVYLENESIVINGIKFWGSPYAPTFGLWAFMKSRSKLDKVWQKIPKDTDVVIVHGPPKGILDVSENFRREIELCGCSALRKIILKIEPKLMLFGHIHNCKDIINAGVLKLSCSKTLFSNGSILTDGKFGVLSSNGNILTV